MLQITNFVCVVFFYQKQVKRLDGVYKMI